MNQLNLPSIRVEAIRKRLAAAYSHKDFVVDKSGCKMVEIIAAQFFANENTIFSKVDHNYIEREMAWYNSANLNISGLGENPPTEWIKSADVNGFVNSNYGWAVDSVDNFEQFNHVVDELLRNHESRRAVMIYTRPNMWIDYNKDGRSDFMCTNDVQYLIRNNELYSIVNMRSNDAVYGYKNDLAWQKEVMGRVANLLSINGLKIELGPIIWNAGSLHVYERHFPLLKCFIETGNYQPSKEELEKFK